MYLSHYYCWQVKKGFSLFLHWNGGGRLSFKSQISFLDSFSFILPHNLSWPIPEVLLKLSSSNYSLILQVLVLCIKKIVLSQILFIQYHDVILIFICIVMYFFLFNFEFTSFRSLKIQKYLFHFYSVVRKQILTFYSVVPSCSS